ncbi:MAG: FeoB-associated Cys-rich membrane protein [Clostridiales bacterium]|nr:FeoB-associated Cys-rich membrane protein [Clostridiales bacterium]
MLQFLSENLANIAVLLVLALGLTAIFRTMIKDKKSGCSSCGNNCSHCAMGGKCHELREQYRKMKEQQN